MKHVNPNLNEVEQTIAVMLAHGHPPKIVAEAIKLTRKALEWRQKQVYSKLGIGMGQKHPRVELTLRAVKEGWVKP